MKNILVTIDFNENEKLLIDKALLFAESFNSKLWLMHIAAPDPDFVGYEDGPQYIRDDRATHLRKENKQLQEYCEMLKEKGVDSEGLIVQGPTIEMIIEESKKLNIDLIIVGHHEHGFFYNAFAENVPSVLVKKSKIPLLIIPLD